MRRSSSRLGIVLLFLSSFNVHAFYTGESYELRGLLRLNGSVSDYPEDQFFYTSGHSRGISEEARLLFDGRYGTNWHYEINLQQAYVPESLLVSRAVTRGVERSAAFHQSFSTHNVNELDLDRLNARWSQGMYDIRMGRQAVNLATTFFFTPNDFFAPFAAQTFYRVYKPGVDAIRMDLSPAELTQLSLISVAGYEADSTSDTGWGNEIDTARNSYLLRAVTVWKDFEWIATAGRVREDEVIGLAASGEWFNWLGIRFEGHMARPRDDSDNTATEFSFGIEHRFENSLNLRLEWFYHGRGQDKIENYSVSAGSATSYLAREYTALAASYEFTPLLNSSFLWLMNQVDQSQLFLFNAVYSLSDESELVVDLTIPHGDKPSGPVLQSEYGLYPKGLSVEYRQYF